MGSKPKLSLIIYLSLHQSLAQSLTNNSRFARTPRPCQRFRQMLDRICATATKIGIILQPRNT